MALDETVPLVYRHGLRAVESSTCGETGIGHDGMITARHGASDVGLTHNPMRGAVKFCALLLRNTTTVPPSLAGNVTCSADAVQSVPYPTGDRCNDGQHHKRTEVTSPGTGNGFRLPFFWPRPTVLHVPFPPLSAQGCGRRPLQLFAIAAVPKQMPIHIERHDTFSSWPSLSGLYFQHQLLIGGSATEGGQPFGASGTEDLSRDRPLPPPPPDHTRALQV